MHEHHILKVTLGDRRNFVFQRRLLPAVQMVQTRDEIRDAQHRYPSIWQPDSTAALRDLREQQWRSDVGAAARLRRELELITNMSVTMKYPP